MGGRSRQGSKRPTLNAQRSTLNERPKPAVLRPPCRAVASAKADVLRPPISGLDLGAGSEELLIADF
jgi:hypothetical protein